MGWGEQGLGCPGVFASFGLFSWAWQGAVAIPPPTPRARAISGGQESPQGTQPGRLPCLEPPTAHRWAQPWGPCWKARLGSRAICQHCGPRGGTCLNTQPPGLATSGPCLLPANPAVLTQPHGLLSRSWPGLYLPQSLALSGLRGRCCCSVPGHLCPFPPGPEQP